MRVHTKSATKKRLSNYNNLANVKEKGIRTINIV